MDRLSSPDGNDSLELQAALERVETWQETNEIEGSLLAVLRIATLITSLIHETLLRPRQVPVITLALTAVSAVMAKWIVDVRRAMVRDDITLLRSEELKTIELIEKQTLKARALAGTDLSQKHRVTERGRMALEIFEERIRKNSPDVF